jgi:hypothetical protein
MRDVLLWAVIGMWLGTFMPQHTPTEILWYLSGLYTAVLELNLLVRKPE